MFIGKERDDQANNRWLAMKIMGYLALGALVALVAMSSINCVQETAPQPSPPPGATPTLVPLPPDDLTSDQKIAIFNTAILDPYVRARIAKAGWRNAQQVGDQLVVNVSYAMGGVTYMRCREIGPDYERWRALPAAEIVPGDARQAGVSLLAFVDTALGRVAYIGFVPRPGAPAGNATFTSIDAGLDEYDPARDLHRYYDNVTVIYTGYVQGKALSAAEIDQATRIAMANATVRGYVGTRNTSMRDTIVYSYETGYPYRYILAYPMVIVDVVEGMTQYDTIFVLTDQINDRVVGIYRGAPPLI